MHEKKKRVIDLLRVSTKKQGDTDDHNQADIPMQRKACNRFIEQKEWELVDEYIELGVSGYKVSAENRDKIQVIKERALRGEFDILLVFMFDRVGRIANETPFIVEWFSKHGIEVWSTQEGEQRFDTDVDHLMNYIRYWQSEGESRKTAIRTRTALGQIVEEGRIKGGLAPYGYRYEKSGQVNKKGKELLKLVVEDYEAEVVRQIFDLFTNRGYGPQKIATHLIQAEIKNSEGKNWHPASIRGILRNLTYNGILRCGSARSKQQTDLLIIDDATWAAAVDLIERRSRKGNDRSVPYETEGMGLLSGNVFCGHCGSRLAKTSSVKKSVAGYQYKRFRYSCYGKIRKRSKCDGQTGYTIDKLDDVIRDVVHRIFRQFGSVKKSTLVGSSYKQREKVLKAEQQRKLREYEKANKDLRTLNAEVVKTLTGNSKFSGEQLSGAIEVTKQECDALQKQLDVLNLQIADIETLNARLEKKYDQVVGWSKMFDDADAPTQRMIVAQLIEKVTVHSGYELDIEFNVDINSFSLEQIEIISSVA